MLIYLSSLTDRIYKILPLRESCEFGDRSYLSKYISSLLVEVKGAEFTFPALSNLADYISILNTIQYLNEYELPISEVKREVFKMIRLVKKLLENAG